MTKKEFAQILAMFQNAYKQKKFMTEEAEWNIWFDCLKDLQFYCLQKAAVMWIQNNKFPPTIAELRESYHNIFFEERNDPKNQCKIWQ